MHSTLVSGWTVTNIGPLTTTYTAPSSCSTDYAYVHIGANYSDPDSNMTSVYYVGDVCDEPIPTVGSCLPSGAKLDEAYSSVDFDVVPVGTTLGYYSPGTICPSGWATVGAATKVEGGSITSSGPGFAKPSGVNESDIRYIDNVGSNVILAGMDEGDAAVLCCPSSFAVAPYGQCTSIVQTFSAPSELCRRIVGGDAGGEWVDTTLSIWGTTVTGLERTYTGTGTITTETMTLETPSEYVGISAQAMLYLVYAATDAAGVTPSATSSSTAPPSSAASVTARSPQLASIALVLSTMAVAFTSGFMLLMA